jgi:hypothetical protein
MNTSLLFPLLSSIRDRGIEELRIEEIEGIEVGEEKN